jgi:hypothetical protein
MEHLKRLLLGAMIIISSQPFTHSTTRLSPLLLHSGPSDACCEPKVTSDKTVAESAENGVVYVSVAEDLL